MHDTWWVRPEDLDEDQKEIIALSLEGSFLVTGPPGSGKTNLLLLRANYAAQGGQPNLVILTVARTLREFLAAGSARYAFPSDKVMTSLRWAYEFLRQYGVRPNETDGDYNAQRESLLGQLEALVEERDLKDVYEVILLDEAQDYWPEEIELFHRLSKRIFAVGDRRQKIYEGNDALERLAALVDEHKRLTFHYRNGLQICKLADGIAKPDPPYEPLSGTCHYDEESRPSSVDEFKFGSLEAQVEAAVERIRIQLETYPGELIGVVCPLKADLERAYELILETDLHERVVLQSSTLGYTEFNRQRPVWMSTLHGSKGLEYRALHLLSAEGLKKFHLNRNMTYTAVTRTKTSLSIYRAASLPGYLEQALVDMNPPVELPTLGAAFGTDTEE